MCGLATLHSLAATLRVPFPIRSPRGPYKKTKQAFFAKRNLCCLRAMPNKFVLHKNNKAIAFGNRLFDFLVENIGFERRAQAR